VLDDVRKHGHVLTPGRYVGADAARRTPMFEEKMKLFTYLAPADGVKEAD
jgi:type I restriction enzyme M protein